MNIKIPIFILLLSISLLIKGQNYNGRPQVFNTVEQMPSFLGGETELYKYIKEKLDNTEAETKNEIKVKVIVRFIVDDEGGISDCTILRGINPSKDKKIIDMVKSMPKWNPGKQNGRAVSTYFMLPLYLSSTQKDMDVSEQINLGNQLFNKKKYEEAIVEYKKAIDLDSTCVQAFVNWGAMLNVLDRYYEAEEKFEKAYTINPDQFNAHAYSNWGASLTHQKRGEDAIAKFEKAVEINPNVMAIYYNWGIAYNSIKKYEEAIVKFEKAITLDITNANAYYEMGSGFMALERYDEALMNYQEALNRNTSYEKTTNFNIGWILQRQERYEESIQYIVRTIELDPNYAEAYYSWGFSLASLKKNKDAVEKYKKAIEINPEKSDYYLALIDLLSDMGKGKEAKKIIQKLEAKSKTKGFNQEYFD